MNTEANIKFKEFQIPPTFFDKLYEFTGASENTRGFILFYVSGKDEPMVRSSFRNSLVELALLKTVSDYVASQQTVFGGGPEPTEKED